MKELTTARCIAGLLFCGMLFGSCSSEQDTKVPSAEPARNSSGEREAPGASDKDRGTKTHAHTASTPSSVQETTANAETEDLGATTTLSQTVATPTTATLAASEQVTATLATDVQSTAAQGVADVGYAGLTRSIDNIERSLTPYLTDRTVRISPTIAAQVRRQTDVYVTELKHAQSVDKDLRNEVRDMAIDIGSAIEEMSTLPPGERYDFLRSLTQRRIEEIQAQLPISASGTAPE